MIVLFATVLSLISLFLILLVLVQRGRGGGLTGALGGMGGQSAFGTKAGDTFTRITIVSATIWILVSILALKMLGGSGGKLGNAANADTTGGASQTSPVDTDLPSGLDGIAPITGDSLAPEAGGTSPTVEEPAAETAAPVE